MPPVAFERPTMLRRLEDEVFDVVVVGGGITGVGVALDAASRGLRTALVDQGDFASGTSSKSSKLIHGGLRYLQQGEVALVYEALAERQRLRKLAPHLVRVIPFMIPILAKGGVVNPKVARALGSAMWMYDLTGGARIGRLHDRLDRDAALAHLPTMPADRLVSAYLYYDGRADDARLCLTVARTAAAYGAVLANYTRVTGFVKDASGHVQVVKVRAAVDPADGGDAGRGAADGAEIDIRTRAVVNAAGVWADEVRAFDEGDAHEPSIRPAKGVHVTLPWSKVRNDIAVVVPVPGDKRSLFVVPWGDFTYVGTTDTDYAGPLADPTCTADDLEYVLGALNHSITTGVTTDDVVGTWAGLRPLVAAAPTGRTADLSRRHRVVASPGNVVTVMGGKLTTYRRMAADAVDEVAGRLGIEARSRTKRLALLGAEGYHEPPDGQGVAAHFAARYGSESIHVEALLDGGDDLAAPLVPGLPYLRAEAVYSARFEMACTVDDVLSRRTRARLLARDASAAAAPAVADLLGDELGWDTEERRRQAAAYQAAVAVERAAAGLTEAPLDALAYGA